jgi:hypothetical protein
MNIDKICTGLKYHLHLAESKPSLNPMLQYLTATVNDDITGSARPTHCEAKLPFDKDSVFAKMLAYHITTETQPLIEQIRDFLADHVQDTNN